MGASRPKVVDGAEAIADVCYHLSDRLWIDPSLPPEHFRDTIESWITAKKRNIWDRVPSLTDEANAQSLLTDPASLPRVLEILKDAMKGRETLSPATGAVVHVSGDKFPLDDPFESKVFVSGSLQEAADFAAAAHRESLTRTQTVLHVFDGNLLPKLIEKIRFVEDPPVEPMEYIGHPEADRVLVAMGHAAGPIEEAVRSQKSAKTGLIRIRLLSPFDPKTFVQKIPGSVQTVFALEHPVLYLKILNALHEGMVNRWSWFAALPRLVKFKSAEQALGLAGLSLSEDPAKDSAKDSEDVRVLWKGLPGDGSLGLVRELAGILGASHEVQACLLPDDGPFEKAAELHLKLSRVPFLSNEIVSKPDIDFVPEDSDIPSGAGTLEAQPPTLAVTALLKAVLAAAESKGMPLDRESCKNRWREALEDYYRPLGPNFVRANTLAAQAVWNRDGRDEKTPDPKENSAPAARVPEAMMTPLILDLPSPTARLLTAFDDRIPNQDQGGALVLPLIRERALQLGLLEAYREQMRRPSLQKARRPFGNRAFGLSAALEGLQALRASVRVPLIARLAAQSLDSWAVLAADLQEAGADALEIVFENGQGQDRVAVVRRLKAALRIPVLVSLDPRQTDLESPVHDLKTAGADGIVLFQELPQRDFDVASRTWSEMALPPGPRHRLEVLEALARLRPRTDLPLVAHGGFSTEADVAKAIALGAQWVQIRP